MRNDLDDQGAARKAGFTEKTGPHLASGSKSLVVRFENFKAGSNFDYSVLLVWQNVRCYELFFLLSKEIYALKMALGDGDQYAASLSQHRNGQRICQVDQSRRMRTNSQRHF